MIIILKSQFPLFDAPVQVAQSVRKDGTVVAAHTRIQKVAVNRPAPHQQHSLFDEPAAAQVKAKRETKLDAWIRKRGGPAAVARTLATMTEGQQQQLLAAMGKLSGEDPADVADRFANLWDKPPEKGETADLFAPLEEPAAAAPTPARLVDADEHGEVPPGKVARREPTREELENRRQMLEDFAASKPNDPRVSDWHRELEDINAALGNTAVTAHLRDKPAAAATEPDDAKIDARLAALANRRHDPTAPFGVPAGISKAARRDINAKVVSLVQDGRTDPALMRQYSGNGGCGDSLNEFYTDPAVAGAMWQVIGRLGITSGTALEPSCATGVFLHTAPAGVRVTGVEMDPISHACAVALHSDRHELSAEPMSLERFARSDGGRQFDVVIGNPPYGPRGTLAKDDKPGLKSAEAYFIDTSIDKAKAGGIVALVVPASVLNNKNGRAFRERMLRKAEFLGAQRMPNTAFEASHTDVTTDVIWLRKRPDDVAGALMTVDKDTLKKLGVWDDEFLAGSYFEGRGAENLFGKAGTAMRAFGEIYTVDGSMAGVPERIAEFQPHPKGTTPTVHDILEACGGDDTPAGRKALGGAMVRPYADGKAGDTKVVDGITYVLQGKPLRWHRVDEMLQHEAVTDAAPIAAELERLLSGQAANRPNLQAAVEAWVARHGIPAKNKALVAAADHDKTLHRLIGAVDHDGRLSDAVTGRGAKRLEGNVEAAAVTLAGEKRTGTFTPAELADRTGKEVDEVEELLHAGTGYALTADGTWTTMDAYLTGDLWPKLDACRASLAGELDQATRAKLELQAKRLEQAIEPASLEDVWITINSAFIPTAVLEAWIDSKTAELRASDPNSKWYAELKPAEVTFANGVYSISGGPWGYSDLLDKYLNRTGVRKDDMPKIEAWNKDFRTWLLGSSLRDQIEDLYNRKFRGFVSPQWSDASIAIPGMAAADLNSYHFSSLRWALHTGKGIIADDVGLGKTVRGLMLARLAKMNGQAQKPTFVVPKSVLANWVAEADKWFPGSRILVIGETYTRTKDGTLKSKPDTETERNRKYHDLTQNDYDFVFISQPAFNELDVDPVTKNNYLDDDFWVQRGEKLGNAGDKKVRKVREQYKQATADREFNKRTDAIYFNQLPIDMLIVDEGHAYKNLYAARARFGESPKFLGGQGQSNRSFDMSFKARWIREQNEGKGIYSLTATPTKNSPLEIYSMLSYIAPEAFERIGVRNSEEFLDRYCVFTNEKILATDGTIEDSLVTSGFKNLDELRGIMDRYIMRRTAKDVGLKLPTPSDEMHMVDMTPAQAGVYGELRAQLAEAGGKKDSAGDAHIFSIMDKMAKAALDLELLDKNTHAGAPSPKYQACAKEVAGRVKDGGQVIFCEAVDSHEKIAQALVAAGVPRERIGIMNAQVAASSAARQNLSDKFNDGRLDVIIGNKVMEEGVNLQKRTTDIHHMDTPWDPATLQQRNGRGLRQGNRNEAVRLHTYLARGSFDGYRYQSMRAKRDWMETLWNGGDAVENLAREGSLSREDIMIAMSADPDAEREKLANDKAAAQEKHAAGERVKASEQYVRFAEMSRSLRALKNKDTASARRLQAQVSKARETLAANPHFKAKRALDTNEDVLISPATGDAVMRDQGVEVSEADGSTSRWVVTGVNALDKTVSMRPYADTTGHRGVVVPLSKLAEGVKEFAFDKDAEAKEVGDKLAAAAQAELESIKSHEQVLKMPAAVVEANRDLLQRQLKEGAKTYKVKFDHNAVPMVNKETGDIEVFPYYEADKKHDTHDYLLPTSDMRERAIQSWINARRGATIGTRHIPASGRGSKHRSGTFKNAREYPGARYDAKHVNPLSSVVNTIDGRRDAYGLASDGPGIKEAKARLEAEQYERIRKAGTTREAFDALMPLASVGDESISYPPKALAMVWAKARQHGNLDKPLKHNIERSAYGGARHSTTAYGGATDETVQHALVSMAAASSKGMQLAVAMSRASAKHAPGWNHSKAFEKMRELGFGFKGDKEARIGALQEALRHAEAQGIADSVPFSSGYGYDANRGKSYRTRIKEQMLELRRQQAQERERAAAAATTEEAA